MHLHHQTYHLHAKMATELENELKAQKWINLKWMVYLAGISVVTLLLIGAITFFSLGVQSEESHYGGKEDECGLVFYEQNLRIVNGIPAVPHSWPAQVYLYFEYFVANYSLSSPNTTEDMTPINKVYGAMCAGTLIGRSTVMTAAHCIPKTVEYVDNVTNTSHTIFVEPNEFYPTYESMFTLYIGFHSINGSDLTLNKGQIRFVKKIIMFDAHFSEKLLNNDIVLLKLDREVTLNRYVQIACLPESVSSTYPSPGTPVYAIGWGRTSRKPHTTSHILRNVMMTVLNGTECKYMSKHYDLSKMCVGDLTEENKSTCQGDSGGSIYVKEKRGNKEKFVSVGIVSYGYICGNDLYPDYFTRVSYYLDWIKANMR